MIRVLLLVLSLSGCSTLAPTSVSHTEEHIVQRDDFKVTEIKAIKEEDMRSTISIADIFFLIGSALLFVTVVLNFMKEFNVEKKK